MTTANVTLLGIGNVLWADEGFGVRAIEELNRRFRFDDNVCLIDGGTQGIYLLEHVQNAEILVVFDAVDYGLEPGTLKIVEGDDVPNFMGAKKMSLHQTGFQEVLAMAELTNGYPRELLLVGVQPEHLEDYGGSLRPVVRAQIAPAIEAALNWLAPRGIHATLREQPLDDRESLNPEALNLNAYETGRPDESTACRGGDERVLRDDHMQFDPKPLPFDAGHVSVNVDHRVKD